MTSLSAHLLEQHGYAFKRPELLTQALTHKSYHNEFTKNSGGDNERFEFLGDSVLGLSMTSELISRFTEMSEGELTKMRASLVNETTLAEIAKELLIDQELRLGKGEKQTGGASKPRLLACGFEAILGAIYLDSDFATVDAIIRKIFSTRISQIDLQNQFPDDFKTRLQEKLQPKRLMPQYEVEKEDGPDHEKMFYVVLKLNGEIFSRGSGRSKKQAEQDAARLAIDVLEVTK